MKQDISLNGTCLVYQDCCMEINMSSHKVSDMFYIVTMATVLL